MATLSKTAASETANVNLDSFDVAAASGGDAFKNDGETLFIVNNIAGASPCVLTVTAQKTSINTPDRGPVTKANGGGSVPAGKVGIFGPFAPDVFNDANGLVQFTYDQVVGVTVAALGTKV